MAEDLRKQKKEQNLRDRGPTTDTSERTKLEHFHIRPLSSLRAAIKRTRTNSQSSSRRERRRPDITIVSVGPVGRTSWFSGESVAFPPQSDWSAGIQTVSQVIQEKTQEDPLVEPTAAPRWSTQTDRKEIVSCCGESPPAPERSPVGKKPQKPPRPLLPKAAERKPASERHVKTPTKTSFPITEGQSDSKCDLKKLEKADSSHTCTRSVTVHWNIPTNHCSVTAAPTETTSANSENSKRPIPRPRTKLRRVAKEEELKVQTLVKFDESCEQRPSDSQEFSTNRYLRELLEVFSGSNKCEGSTTDQSDEKSQDEHAVGEMNPNHSQQNFRARIQAFESQAGAEGGDESQTPQTNLPPRRASFKPPVATKPSAAFKTQNVDDFCFNASAAQNYQNPFTSPRPQPAAKPGGQSIRDELQALHSKGITPQRSFPPVLTRSESTDEDASPFPPVPMKPFREPLKPNLNINNHNSASVFTDTERVDSLFNNIPVKPQYSMNQSGSFSNKPTPVKRPTIIKVPSKTGLSESTFSSIGMDNFQDSVPNLPVRKPIGSVNIPGGIKHSMSLQNSYSIGPQPTLPPRNPSMNKSFPPRPPPAKTGPGRPLPSNLQTVGQSQSVPQQPSPKNLQQMPPKKGLLVPPRPCPGHRLYNKYTLPLPHGIATFDFDGSDSGELSLQKNEVVLLLEEINGNEFECQVGDTRGRVRKSRVKVITPLDSDWSSSQDVGASGGDGYGLKVRALFDFFPGSSDDLTLREGDIVTDVEQVDDQWYRGTLNGSTGFFPINYVEVLSNSPKLLPKKKPKPKSSTVSGPRCEARFDFEGEHSDELSFLEGDVIQLKEYVGEDWARGQVGISVGIFPLNFVDIIEDLPPSPSQQQSSRVALPGMTASETAKPAQVPKSSVEWAVALYDYAAKSNDELSFQHGDRILVTKHLSEEWSSGRLNGREGMFPRAFIETNTAGQRTNHQRNEVAAGGRGRALYSFVSNCDEELTFQVGEIITNLESIDDEWYLGELRGKRALVPKNYVEVLE